MSLTENRSWTITCKRGLVDQCLDNYTLLATEEIRSTAAAEKELRDDGWTLHDGGTGTCPVCMDVWNGEIELSAKGEVKIVPTNGGSMASTPLLDE